MGRFHLKPKLLWLLGGGIVAILLLLSGGWFFWLKPQSQQKTAALPEQVGFMYSIFDVKEPVGIALSPDGSRLYVAERAGDRLVRVFDSKAGKEIQTLAPPNSTVVTRRPVYLAVNQLGYVFVNDLSQKGLSVYSPSGEFQGWLNPFSSDNNTSSSDTWSPLALAFGKDGTLYVTDVSQGKHRVLVFDSKNKLKLEFGVEGTDAGEFSFPNGIVVRDNGEIWVSDSNNARIQVSDPTGKLLTMYKEVGGQSLSLPRGIGFSKYGDAVVVDTIDSSVTIFNPGDLQKSYRLGEFGTGNGQFRYPQGLAIDSNGNLYVSDRDNNRIQVFKLGKA